MTRIQAPGDLSRVIPGQGSPASALLTSGDRKFSVVRTDLRTVKRLAASLTSTPGGGHGNPLQYFCLGNPMDRGAWQPTVRRVTKESDRAEGT